MRLQGDLQSVYNALDDLGIIQTVLQKDWVEMHRRHRMDIQDQLNQLLLQIQQTGPEQIPSLLKSSDDLTLQFLAMEVAREYVEYYEHSHHWDA